LTSSLREIAVVWLKRDLRFEDHAAFQQALRTGLPVVAHYVWNTDLMVAADWDVRHGRFVQESIDDLNRILKQSGVALSPKILEVISSAENVFAEIINFVRIKAKILL
jgi:deoxyribodipyrimidine photo-lyase